MEQIIGKRGGEGSGIEQSEMRKHCVSNVALYPIYIKMKASFREVFFVVKMSGKDETPRRSHLNFLFFLDIKLVEN